ncbi:HAD hydrolase family protein [Alphaproteobacteria bacterium]|nr:HAD hydrolase family protein [Alphaproteobacteria bacterium]
MLKLDISKVNLMVIDCDGVLTDNRVLVREDGMESVYFSRADGLAFDALKRLNIETVIMSSETNNVVSARGHKLGVQVYQGVDSKLSLLQRLILENNFTKSNVVYIGNDINDLLAMSICGLSFCPSDAHHLIRNAARFILKTNGGDGVMREVVEDYFKVNIHDLLYK